MSANANSKLPGSGSRPADAPGILCRAAFCRSTPNFYRGNLISIEKQWDGRGRIPKPEA